MPYYRCQLTTALGTPEVIERLRGMCRAEPSFVQSLKEGFWCRAAGTPPFIGSVADASFAMCRDIRYRNSFLPRIQGQLTPLASGTLVDVTMRMHVLTTAFMAVWFGLVGLAIAATVAGGDATEVAFPFGMVVFGVVLTCGGFYPEAWKARRMLCERLEAEVAES